MTVIPSEAQRSRGIPQQGFFGNATGFFDFVALSLHFAQND
jgi:hypothetical protein